MGCFACFDLTSELFGTCGAAVLQGSLRPMCRKYVAGHAWHVLQARGVWLPDWSVRVGLLLG